MRGAAGHSAEYEVERLVDRRVEEGEEQYLVKWKGYPMEQCSWEPLSALKNCLRLVREFDQRARREAVKSRCSRAKTAARSGPKAVARAPEAVSLADTRELAALLGRPGPPTLALCLIPPLIDGHAQTPQGTFFRLRQANASGDALYLHDAACRRIFPARLRAYLARSSAKI